MRDVNLLALALVRPATAVMGAEAYSQLALKAALLESLTGFPLIIDGTKCIAWILRVLLLRINGYRHGFSTTMSSTLSCDWPPATPICSAAPSLSRSICFDERSDGRCPRLMFGIPDGQSAGCLVPSVTPANSRPSPECERSKAAPEGGAAGRLGRLGRAWTTMPAP
ncbi:MULTISPECIES: hypothetical protein [Arthrobacter]|uniref:Secreted protein n=1 Tax=Arthrobacter bambusae TaxID=1338426 RepID=A0AAW8DGM0_9MICC|nr:MULTISPECIES: hypothetical protein [Arthrobacter]MDP9905460.1 hypothetical protein [Arthrobacter bambusae]MDQ0127458.1 hypothetical protein [Arthrobacter bambusae]MDQ0178800.1 hypothetical protein [Arthrobacter bambusae]